MNRLNKYILRSIFYTALMLSGTINSFAMNLEDPKAVEEANSAHFNRQVDKVTDDELRRVPDITEYRNRFEQAPDELSRAFAVSRLYAKQESNLYNGMTLTHVETLKRDEEFMQKFVVFLKAWVQLEFMSNLDRRAVELSRGAPTDEYPLGRIQLDSGIRTKNAVLISELDKRHDALYNEIDRGIARCVGVVAFCDRVAGS